MGSREDKLLALVGLLSACLIAVMVLFTLTLLSDVRHPADDTISPQSCYATPPHSG